MTRVDVGEVAFGRYVPDHGPAAPVDDAMPASVPLRADFALDPAGFAPLPTGRSMAVSVVAAAGIHGLILIALLLWHTISPFGSDGQELEAIDVDIVLSSAIEARSTQAIVAPDAQAADRPVHERDGNAAEDAAAATESPSVVQPDDVAAVARPLPPEEPADHEAALPEPAESMVATISEPARPPESTREKPAETEEQTQETEPEPPSTASAASEEAAAGGVSSRGELAVDSHTRAASAARPGEASAYARAVVAALAKRRPKPSPGDRGTVRIIFTISPAGEVQIAQVRRSSGSPTLDEAALAAVRSTRFPVPPAGMNTAELTYEIPYIFR